MPAAQAPRGALGDPGLRTEADPLRGIEGGFKTDVLHRPNAASPGVPAGSALSPRYPWGAAAPGTVGFGGTTQQPASRGGGIGANPLGQVAGYKRSDDPADIRTASLYDFPGTSSPTDVITWTFESAAIGEDTMVTYGAVNWGFTVDAGHVTNEHLQVEAGTSATFDEALERHRDFYVHEPVTFYFDFNDDALNATEEAKIDSFLAYLTRNPDVELALEGFADQVGGASQYNRDLSLRRAHAVEAALLAKGIAAARINGIIIGHGASTAATADAGTGDEGGDAAVGADQSREANRWANRRVILTFSHVPAATPDGRSARELVAALSASHFNERALALAELVRRGRASTAALVDALPTAVGELRARIAQGLAEIADPASRRRPSLPCSTMPTSSCGRVARRVSSASATRAPSRPCCRPSTTIRTSCASPTRCPPMV
jgi:outer membrane protein OmpA-like peptidoglycan-associated protein